MSSSHEDRLDPNKPTLIVLYGATKRKFRPLEGDLIILGRAPGCDIGLVSPEVAPVHCVLVRTADGWRLRDCSGRATRINGKSVHDEPLRNGDTIQVGTFSFEAQLPPLAAPPVARLLPEPAEAPDTERLQASRRRLAELALGLRRRMRERAGDRAELARQQADLEQVERRLRKAHDEQMTRLAALGEEQKQLARRAEELDLYAAHLRRQARHSRDEAGQQVRQVEVELHQQRVEQNRAGEELARLRAELEGRQAELDETAMQLAAELKAEREQLERDRHELAHQLIKLERDKEQLMRQTPVPMPSRDTEHDRLPGDKLESARQLLRELAERRKSAEARPRNSSGRP